MRRLLALLAVLILALAGCAGNGTDGTDDTGGTADSPPATAPDTTTGLDADADSPGGEDTDAADDAADVQPQPAGSSEMLAGTFDGQLPEGQSGEVTIVAQGDPYRSQIPFIVRNMTGDEISRVQVSGTATADGEPIGSGQSQSVHPNVVQSGHIAFGFVYFGTDDLPDNATADLTVDYDTGIGEFENIVAAIPTDLTATGDSITGQITNPHDTEMEGPVDVAAACFDAEGNLAGIASTFADRETVEPDGSASFTIDLFDLTCEQFLVGASGFEPME